ncbi:hypothetical protein PENTCL1PPCAC_16550, partial [Pristionchus entomophagus]
DIIPCTYQYMHHGTNILVTGLLEFLNTTFPEFRVLPKADKWIFIRNYQKVFHCIDAGLRCLRRFGNGSYRIFGTYTTSLSAEFVDHYFSDCPNPRNTAAAASTFRASVTGSIPAMQKRVYLLDPSEHEYLALIGLAFWTVENLDLSDRILDLAARSRAAIMAELVTHIKDTFGAEKAAARLGSLLCILQEFRRVVMDLKVEYEIYRLLDVFDDNTLMYKLQMDQSNEFS